MHGIHTYIYIYIKRERQREGQMNISPKIIHMTLSRPSPRPAGLKKANCHTVTACEMVHVVGNYERPLVPKGSLHPTTNKNLGSSVLKPKDQNSANNINEFGSRYSPTWTSRRSLVNILIVTFQNPKQRTQLSNAHSFS